MLAKLAALEQRLGPKGFGLVVFLALLVARSYLLADPPYWDALMGAFPQGVWLAEHGFDLAGLLTQEKVFVDGGPNVYPFSLYPLAIGALLATGVAPATVFVVFHVASLACAAVAAGALYSVARARLPAPAGFLLAIAFVTAPLFQATACQMSLDMPLVACTALSLAAMDQRRFGGAFGWALAALLVKYTAVILIGANLVLCVLLWWKPRWCGLAAEASSPEERARAARGALLHALLLGVFLVEVLLVARYAKEPAFLDPFGGWKHLFLRRLWTIPEYGLAVLLFLAGLPLLVKRMLGGHARWIQVQCGVFLVAFLLFYGQYTNTLPRYFLQSYPVLFLWLALSLYGSEGESHVRAGVLMVATAFHLVNQNGLFYPSRPSGWTVPTVVGEIAGNDGYVLERSMEYRDDLRLNQDLARALEAFPRERTVVVANWPLLQLLAVPELGYVDRPWRTASPDIPLSYDEHAVSYWDLYAKGARPRKLEPDVDVVWALTPNTFSGPQTTLSTANDELLVEVARGAHRAFLVRRRGWE
ncbi:MAG: hypothetical protein IPJ77_01805 [Planctomycetes bacterium]|nr:hypothetical protein [Planctomycetota bacterium]